MCLSRTTRDKDQPNQKCSSPRNTDIIVDPSSSTSRREIRHWNFDRQTFCANLSMIYYSWAQSVETDDKCGININHWKTNLFTSPLSISSYFLKSKYHKMKAMSKSGEEFRLRTEFDERKSSNVKSAVCESIYKRKIRLSLFHVTHIEYELNNAVKNYP